jgi:hypothetical protein
MSIVLDGTAGVTFPAGGLGNTAGAAVGTTDTQTLTNKTLTTPNIDSAQFATVTGTAPLYAARAWVNFNGTGTVAIRESGNVSSITDNGTGDYTVNFTTAMPDANYSIVCGSSPDYAPANSYGTYINTVGSSLAESAPTTSSARISYRRSDALSYDPKYSNIAIFR